MLGINFINILWVSFNQGLNDLLSSYDIGINVGATNVTNILSLYCNSNVQIRRCFPFWLMVISNSLHSKSRFVFQGWDYFLYGFFPRAVILWKLILTWQGNFSMPYKDSCYRCQIWLFQILKINMFPLVWKKGRRSFLGYPSLLLIVSTSGCWPGLQGTKESHTFARDSTCCLSVSLPLLEKQLCDLKLKP